MLRALFLHCFAMHVIIMIGNMRFEEGTRYVEEED